MAFSIACTAPRSQTWIVSMRGFRRVDRAELLQRGDRAVVVDRQRLDQAGVGAAGADAVQVAAERLDGAVHRVVGARGGSRRGRPWQVPPGVRCHRRRFGLRARRHDRADAVAAERVEDGVRRCDIEDDDREVVFHAQLRAP